MGRVSAVQACFLASIIGLISAQGTFDCAFTDEFCRPPPELAKIELEQTGLAAQQAAGLQVCHQVD